jgi:hypothetical protein
MLLYFRCFRLTKKIGQTLSGGVIFDFFFSFLVLGIFFRMYRFGFSNFSVLKFFVDFFQ